LTFSSIVKDTLPALGFAQVGVEELAQMGSPPPGDRWDTASIDDGLHRSKRQDLAAVKRDDYLFAGRGVTPLLVTSGLACQYESVLLEDPSYLNRRQARR
jgi:hypothetical protein